MIHNYYSILSLIILWCPLLSYSQSAFYILAEDYAKSGNYEEAIRLTKMSLKLDTSNPNKDILILDYCAISEYFSYISQPDSCLYYANKAISCLSAKSGDDYLNVLRILSPHMRRAGFCQTAIDYRKFIINETVKTYGSNSSRLLNEYRIVSSYSIDNKDFQNAIEYAKKEEKLAYLLRDVEDNFESRIPYEDSLGWLRYVLQMYDESTDAASYLNQCLNVHSNVINEEEQKNTFNCMAAISRAEENKGNYSDAIRIRKLFVEKEKGSEMYIEDIASIARCYSNMNQADSTILYCNKTNELAEQLINDADSVAEGYIQSSAWCLYRIGEYDLAVKSAKKVLSLRENIYGKESPEYIEWLGIMSYNALQNNDLSGMVIFCDEEAKITKDYYGINSKKYENFISSVRGYAHQVVCEMPEFTVNWIQPYYNIMIENEIFPELQYEYEILLLEGFLALGDLQSADKYAQKLIKWTYSSFKDIISLEDRIRIWLKLANYDLTIGDHIKARWRIMESDSELSESHQSLSLTQLMDRHIVERNLRMDTLGRARINAEWLIETATPVIEAGVEDDETLAFFYESIAWAYEGMEEYDLAIDNIKQSLVLNHSYSRKKKLGQLYLHKKQFEAAKKIFYELYNDESLPISGRKSIGADLIALYWLLGDKDNISLFMAADIENLKKDTRHAFAFLNEKERETFLMNSLLGTTIYFDMFTSFSSSEKQWAEGNGMAYNLALMQKGLLMKTTNEISNILNNVPDSLQNELKLYQDLQEFERLPDYESSLSRETRVKLMNYVAAHPDFMSQLNYSWNNVAEKLTEHEAAIEFINLLGAKPNNMVNKEPSLGALILRKGCSYPIFVKLTNNAAIDSLYYYGEDQERFNDFIYTGGAKRNVYKAIWEPMSAYLDGIETIYYAPVGPMQEINLDWIGYDDYHNLSSEYKLYRLSSTREICNHIDVRSNNDAILYGDITYSIKSQPLKEKTGSKYRSSKRAGFGSLTGTSNELDSITYELNLVGIKSADFRKELATENTFRMMSGLSPRILHIATHGFYYSREAIEKEFQSGNFTNFIAYQGMNPNELCHSGLALSGAQDTWHNEVGDLSQYLEMDSDNDGILLSSEISKLDLTNTDLVVLSACETALGKVKSEGVYGLQRAFKLAGVNSIIMTLWTVDDDATQLLMTSFYKNYLNGMSKREALLTAQKKVRETPGYGDPYYWAAFILLDGLN